MSKEMMEKKNDLITRAEAVLDKAKQEKRELTDAEAAELAEIRDNVRKIIEFMKLDDDFRELGGMEKKPEPKEGTEVTEEEKKKVVEEQEQRAFESYIRGIVLNERAAGDNLTMAGGNALIPTTILNKIVKKVYEICPILDRSSKYNVKGNLDIPYYGEDSTNLVQVAYQQEFVELTSNVGTFTSVQLTGYLAGALTLISRSLLNSQNFNLTQFIVDHMAYAIKRFIEGELLNGTDGKVEGLSGVTIEQTAAATNVITADEIIQLHDSIIDDFQGNAIWIMSRKTRTALRMLKDEMGRYMLQDDISLPFGSSLLGKPIYVSDNMPEIGAGTTPIYYGDMSGLATKWVEEMNIEVLREKYATQHAIGVVGWLEFDSKVENAQKIAKLVMAAS
jgi:HK97 family phage major capsid protein